MWIKLFEKIFLALFADFLRWGTPTCWTSITAHFNTTTSETKEKAVLWMLCQWEYRTSKTVSLKVSSLYSLIGSSWKKEFQKIQFLMARMNICRQINDTLVLDYQWEGQNRQNHHPNCIDIIRNKLSESFRNVHFFQFFNVRVRLFFPRSWFFIFYYNFQIVRSWIYLKSFIIQLPVMLYQL